MTDRGEPPTTLDEARLSIDHAARLLAVADGLCAIGQLRTGARAGQFSIFNFLIRCAPDAEYPPPDERTTHVVLMQAGIIRRHGWFAYFWLPDGERPLRLALPAPISGSWRWHDDLDEIGQRLAQSEAWTQAVGQSVEDRVSYFRAALAGADVVRSAKDRAAVPRRAGRRRGGSR